MELRPDIRIKSKYIFFICASQKCTSLYVNPGCRVLVKNTKIGDLPKKCSEKIFSEKEERSLMWKDLTWQESPLVQR